MLVLIVKLFNFGCYYPFFTLLYIEGVDSLKVFVVLVEGLFRCVPIHHLERFFINLAANLSNLLRMRKKNVEKVTKLLLFLI